MQNQQQNIFSKIIRGAVYLLVFLLPFFFLPWPYEKVEFAKQILLWTLAGTAFLAWLGKMAIHDKEIRFKKDWFSIAVAIFTIVNLLIFLVSKDKYASLWGRFGRYSDSLLGLLAMVLLFYTVVNNWTLFGRIDLPTGKAGTNVERINTNHESDKSGTNGSGLVRALLYGTFVGEMLLILSVYGWIGKVLAWIPGNIGVAFQQVMTPTFNVFGAFKGGGAIYLVVILIINLSLHPCGVISQRADNPSPSQEREAILQNEEKHSKDSSFPLSRGEVGERGSVSSVSVSRIIFLLLTLWCLAILNFPPAWILLIILLICISGYKMYISNKQKSVKMSDIIMPIIIVSVSVIFLFNIVGRSSVFPAIPNEARLSAKESLMISLKSLRENFAFGSGQGNFAYNFSKFKSQSFNDLDVWQLRFNKADNYATELLATTGILGLLAWVGLLCFIVYAMWQVKSQKSKVHKVQRDGDDGLSTFNFQLLTSLDFRLYGLSTLVLGQFFYSSTTLLLFTTWLLIILAVAPLVQDAQEFCISKIFKDVPETLLAADVALAIFAILFAAFLINVSGKYRANVAFAKIAENSSVYSDNDKQAIIVNAAKLDKKNSLYPISLTRIYLSKIKEEIKKAPSQQSKNLIRDLAEAVVNSAVRATELSPNSVSAWELRGSVYRDIYSVVDEAESAILSSFETAINLEPLNPILLTELGKAYILTGDNVAAQEALNKALELKSEYEEAKIQLAIVKDKTGMSEEAIGELEAISSRKPNDARIFFETGRIYFNNENIDEAIKNFQKAVQLFPEYSNALYSLALCYTKNGQTQEAIATFERVLELNPNSNDVKGKISELKGENVLNEQLPMNNEQ